MKKIFVLLALVFSVTGCSVTEKQTIENVKLKAYDKSGNLTSVAKSAADKARAAAHSKYSLAKGQGDLFRHGIRKGKFLKNASDTIDIPYSN